jgi:uncharacterized protein (DUF58 family)
MGTRIKPANLLTYLVLLAFSATGAYLLNNRLGYTPLLFLLLLLPLDALCALCARRCAGGLKAPEFQTAELGSPAVFRYACENRSRFLVCHLRVRLRPAGPEGTRFKNCGAALDLAPGTAGVLSLSMTARHIGVYRVRMRSARVFGPLGIFSVKLPVPRPAVLAVTPSRGTAAAAGPAAGGRLSEDAAQSLHGGPHADSYDGVREYAPGDRLRSIHWKLTAHNRKLMTRLYEQEEEGYATVAVDLRPGPGTAEQALCIHDALCESAFRFVCGRVGQGGKIRLVFLKGEGLESIRIRSEADLPEAAVRLASAGPAPEVLTDAPGAFPAAGEMLIVSARLDAETARRLGDFAGRRNSARFILVAPPQSEPEDFPAYFRYLTGRGVDCTVATAARTRRARKERLRADLAPNRHRRKK